MMEIPIENDIGRGVYYACMSDRGYQNYWLEGLKRSLSSDPGFGQNKYQVLANELDGARLYFDLRAQGKI